MIVYEELLSQLHALADEKYREFHKKLLKADAVNVIGVRMPDLRRLARAYRGELAALLAFPDEYYEVTLLKCAVANFLPFGQLCAVCDGLVGLLDNWATCDMFAPACIAGNRAAFKPYISRYLADPRPFVRRFAFTTLLHFYVVREELPYVFSCLERADDGTYYVSMAAAWLTAEVLTGFFEEGFAFLKRGALPPATLRRAVQKACESFRVTDAQKEKLRGLRKKVTK